ncbi:Uncharacterised ACR (DUF711) (Partial), partial [Seminavis robusta]
MKPPLLFRVRTVTAFLSLQPQDFPVSLPSQSQQQQQRQDDNNLQSSSKAAEKISQASALLETLQTELTQAGYEVQTVRIATNPFGEWLSHDDMETAKARLCCLNQLLDINGIAFCAVGPAQSIAEIESLCAVIVETSPYVSCSATVAAGDVVAARAAAHCMRHIAGMANGLGNFRFCAAAATCPPGIPFFPVAKAASCNDTDGDGSIQLGFAIGLENGPLAHHWLSQAGSIANIPTVFKEGMASALSPLQDLCLQVADINEYSYLGMDTSLNPSLDADNGSVAAAIECLSELDQFGGPGTIAAAAAITTALQSLPDIQLVGYCGLMLPVCEDHRLAALATSNDIQIADLLSISSVCGVGIDTV